MSLKRCECCGVILFNWFDGNICECCIDDLKEAEGDSTGEKF